MPRLVRDPNRESLNQNPYAALADDSDDEVRDADTPRPNNTNGTEDQEPRTYASVASSSSGSHDAGDQPSFAKLTKLPATGMRQRRTSADTRSNKRDRTPKTTVNVLQRAKLYLLQAQWLALREMSALIFFLLS